MNFFERIFRRKDSSRKADAAPTPAKSARPIASDSVLSSTRLEDNNTLAHSLTTGLDSPPQSPDMRLPKLFLIGRPDVGVVVDAIKDECSERQVLLEVDTPPNALISSSLNVSLPLGSSSRELALMCITITLREVLTQRLFQELASSKFEIARLCSENLDRIRIKSSVDDPVQANSSENQAQPGQNSDSNLSSSNATIDQLSIESTQEEGALLEQLKRRIGELELENTEIRSIETEGLEQFRLKLSRQELEIVQEKERLEKRIQEIDAQSRRLAERESTVWKNFSELQRREKILADLNVIGIDKVPQGVSALVEEVKRLQAQIDSVSSSARKRETKLAEEVKFLKGRLASNADIALGSSLAAVRETKLVDEIRALRERANSDSNAALKKQIALQEQLDLADRSIKNLLKAKHGLERGLQAARPVGAPSQKRTKQDSNSDSTLIDVSDYRIIDWMLDNASPEQALVDHGYLCLTGDGPWPDQKIREMMEKAGFSLWRLPDADVGHVVVGRHSWDSSAIEQQIVVTAGKKLRIYSQEMWFAKLVTGRDPFDANDNDLLMAFAKGHPALEYLIDRDAPWPELSSGGLVLGGSVITDINEFGVNSPLRNFGYQVGVSSGLSVAQRRALLVKFIESKDLSFDEGASAEYRAHWGRPRSLQRLFRVASHIKWLIGWQGKSPHRKQANEDWRGDLQWLKKTYYRPNQHKFRWPGV